MTTRLVIAYLLIAMLVAAAIGSAWWMRRSSRARHAARWNRRK